MKNENAQKNKIAILQLLCMFLSKLGIEAAVTHIKNEYKGLLNSKGEFRALGIKAKTLVLTENALKGKPTGKWYRMAAQQIGELVGMTFYTLSGNSGFNASNETAVSKGILRHFGILKPDDPLAFANRDSDNNVVIGEEGFILALDGLFTTAEADQFATGNNNTADDEFATANVTAVTAITVADSVSDFDPLSAEARSLYPLVGLVMSFFEMIKTCGSKIGIVLNYKHKSTLDGKVRNWRPSENAKVAIANGADSYRNDRGTLKEVRCISSYADKAGIDLSTFGYDLACEIVLKSFHYNYKNINKVFYHMAEKFMRVTLDENGDSDKGVKAAMGFVACGMRMILDAVNNGAPIDDIGVGFVRYLDEDIIDSVLEAYSNGQGFYDPLGQVTSDNNGRGLVINESFDNPLE